MQRVLPFFFLTLALAKAQTLTSRPYGGSGNDTVGRVATDAQGNLYIAGTTTSFDLPLQNPWQPGNSGSPVAYSTDAGATWQAMGNLSLPPVSPLVAVPPPVLAVSPADPNVVYAGYGGNVFRSTDHGLHFAGTALPGATFQTSVTGIVVDPANPSRLFVSATVSGGVFRSLDGGGTWTALSKGLPAKGFVSSVALDPFHPNTVWVWDETGAFVSRDAGESWSQSSLQVQGSLSGGGVAVTFDPLTPGVLYGPGMDQGRFVIEKSVDGGATWHPLNAPFTSLQVTPDPVRAGYLYGFSATSFYRSYDGGKSWLSSALPGLTYGSLAVNPADPNILLLGEYRSTDGGATWVPSPISRPAQPAFAPSAKGIVYAGVPVTSDAFLAKFAPDGRTLLFATYFGGMGTETAASVQVDPFGNLWLLGTTTSANLPVTSGAVQRQRVGAANFFVAGFSPSGQLLYSTYFGSSGADSAKALAIDPSGDVWITGVSGGADYPVTVDTPKPSMFLGMPPNYPVVTKLDPGGHIAFSAFISPFANDQPTGIAADAWGNAIVTGTTYSSNFPASDGAYRSAVAPAFTGKPFVVKFDSSGNRIFSTYVGGTKSPTPMYGIVSTWVEERGAAIAVDPAGNIYLAGRTTTTDFPVTPGAFQSALGYGCTYPSFSIYTGFIGTILEYYNDDVFVTKLSPDGSTLLGSTLLGGACYDRPSDLAIGPDGAVYVTGETNSIDFPLQFPLQAAPPAGAYKSFLSVLDPALSALRFSTYLSAGANPTLAITADGLLHVGGSIGNGAQTSSNIGGIFGPTLTFSNGYLAALDLSSPPPPLNLSQVLNAFSLLPGPAAPAEIVALTLPGYSPAQPVDLGLNGVEAVTTSLNGVSVLFDGQPVPLVSLLPGKIVALAPKGLQPGRTTVVQVNDNGALSNTLAMDVGTAAVGLLSADGIGTGLANARNDDGQLNDQDHPAARGSTVTLYYTGGGVIQSTVWVNNKQAEAAPLMGFVPGINSARFVTPTDPAYQNRLNVSLYTQGSSSQTLTIWMQ